MSVPLRVVPESSETAATIARIADAIRAHRRVRMTLRRLGQSERIEHLECTPCQFEPPDHPFGVIVEHRSGVGRRIRSTVLIDSIVAFEPITAP